METLQRVCLRTWSLIPAAPCSKGVAVDEGGFRRALPAHSIPGFACWGVRLLADQVHDARGRPGEHVISCNMDARRVIDNDPAYPAQGHWLGKSVGAALSCLRTVYDVVGATAVLEITPK
jgi:hypothetical protein